MVGLGRAGDGIEREGGIKLVGSGEDKIPKLTDQTTRFLYGFVCPYYVLN